MPKRKKHSKEFKKQAIDFWESHDLSSEEAAAELGIRADMLRHWKSELNKDEEAAFPGTGHAKQDEVTQLKKRITEIEEENAILKKAIAVFSKPRKKDSNL
jgi:transposase